MPGGSEFNTVVMLVRNIPKHAEWKKERDRLGGKSNAVSGVNLGDALDSFHKKFDAEDPQGAQAVIAKLGKEVDKYCKAVKAKQPKVFSYLDGQVMGSLNALTVALIDGPTEQNNKAKLRSTELSERLSALEIRAEKDLGKQQAAAYSTDFNNARKAIREASGMIKKDKWLDLDAFDKSVEAAALILTEVAVKLADQEGMEPEYESAEEHWEEVFIPRLIGELNAACSKLPNVVLAKGVQPQKAIEALCADAMKLHQQRFQKAFAVSPMSVNADSAKNDPLFKQVVDLGRKLLFEAVWEVEESLGAKGAPWLARDVIPEPQPKKGGKTAKMDKGVKESPEEDPEYAFDQLAKKVLSLRSTAAIVKALGDGAHFPHSVAMRKKMGSVSKHYEYLMKHYDAGRDSAAIDDAVAARNSLETLRRESVTSLSAIKSELPDEASSLLAVLGKLINGSVSILEKAVEKLEE